VPFPVGSHAVAGDHQHRGALDGDSVPDMDAVAVEGDRYLAHGSPRSRQALCRLAYHGVDIGLGIGPAKPFLNDPDPQAAGVSSELLGIRFRTQSTRLARVEAIGPGEHLEKPGGIAGGTGNGPGMIKC